jgi:hypothetical protein
MKKSGEATSKTAATQPVRSSKASATVTFVRSAPAAATTARTTRAFPSAIPTANTAAVGGVYLG